MTTSNEYAARLIRLYESLLKADDFEIEQLGGGLLGLVRYNVGGGTIVITDDDDALLLGFYPGDSWSECADSDEFIGVTVSGEYADSAILTRIAGFIAERTGTEITIASYFDGSGEYRIVRRGEDLLTIINLSEIIVQRMTRSPQFDNWESWSEFPLTDTFASTMDLAYDGDEQHGAVLINGEAFVLGEPESEVPIAPRETMIRYTVAANPVSYLTLIEPDAATGYFYADVDGSGRYTTIRPDLLADRRQWAIAAWNALVTDGASR